MIGVFITTSQALIECLAFVLDVAAKGMTWRQRAALQKLLLSLRTIYFYDDRTISILDRVIAGEIINVDDIERALRGFEMNDGEIREAIEHIQQVASDPIDEIPVSGLNVLRGLGGLKGNIRNAVRSFLENATLPENDEAHSKRIEQASEIRNQIEQINRLILQIDQGLRGSR